MTEHQVTLKFGYNIRRYLFFALGFPGGSVVKTACSAQDSGDVGSPGSGRSPGGGNGNPLQYSCLKNPMDRGGPWVSNSRTQLSVHRQTHIHILSIK